MGGGLGRVTEHHEYYLSDGSVSFLTGSVLFRVHQSFFERESDVFRDLFETAAVDDPQSGTDARPFTLDVTCEEFEQLLWVWYDRDYSYHSRTKDNWVTILRLSTRWEFLKIRQLAIRALDALALSPAERIAIYNEHAIEGEQLYSSYAELCRSPTVPSEADGRLIPMEILIKLLQAREDAQRKAVELGHESPTSASLEDEALREIISKRFNEGLNPQSHGTSTGSGGQASDLNGERAYATRASTSTITMGKPQVPDRTVQSASGPSHLEQGKEVKSEIAPEKAKGEGSDEAKLVKAAQEKEKEEKAKRTKEKEEQEKREKAKQAKEKEEKERAEKAKQAKEKEEAERAEKAKQAKEKEDKERAEKAKQDKEKEAREKDQKAGQKPSQGSRKPWEK